MNLAKLPDGQWLIPSPQQNGRVTGTVPSSYKEGQFNANFDYQLGAQNSLSSKFFLANAPQLAPLVGNVAGSANLPGFGMQIENDNPLLSVSYIHLFGSNTFNEARLGYNFIRNDQFPQEPIRDSDLGIQRTTAGNFPWATPDPARARCAGRIDRLAVFVAARHFVNPCAG